MNFEKIEEFKVFIQNNGLPIIDVVLFGVTCPFCGKNDRIRALELPGEIENELTSDKFSAYQRFWDEFLALAPHEDSLAVCKFCSNILALNNALNTVYPLY